MKITIILKQSSEPCLREIDFVIEKIIEDIDFTDTGPSF